MKKILFFTCILIFIVFLGFHNTSLGQVPISESSSVIQNFDSLGNYTFATLPTGWKADNLSTVRTVGTYAAASITTTCIGGSLMSPSATNGIYNFAKGVPSTTTDRGIGGLSSDSASKSVNIYVCLQNTGVVDIPSFRISFEVDKYRRGSNPSPFGIQMYYSIDGTTWTNAGSAFGYLTPPDNNDNGYNGGPGLIAKLRNRVLNVNVAVGGKLYLAWNYSVASGTTTSHAQALGIDNIYITSNIPTWSGLVNNDWNTAGNWVANAVPLSTDDVIIPANCPNYPNILTPVICKDARIRLGALVTINNECNFPSRPLAGTNIQGIDQISWNWNTVTGALGYKWNNLNDYNSAIDLGTATSKVETGLICSTEYIRYVWAYSVCGNSVPLTMVQKTSGCPFPCGQTLTDTRDGRSYNTVLIGTQCWMAQNLNIGIRINGNQEPTSNNTIEKYCYNDLETNCSIYGGLYQWNEMMKYWTPEGKEGICPSSWHLPTETELCTLTQYIDPTVDCYALYNTGTDVGIKMKSTSGWYNNGNGTNSSGFNAFPSGSRWYNGTFNGLTTLAYFWSSSGSNGMAWSRYFSYNNMGMYHYWCDMNFAMSVRCVKD